MNLSRRLLEQKVNDYEDPIYEEELERIETLPEVFSSGEWTQDDLEWIIKWKVGTAFEKPTLRHIRSNSDEQIRRAIETAVNARAVGEKVNALTSIKGVGVPVASAILLFINPDRYTVIDVRAWGALYEMGYVDRELSDDPTIEEYLLYLGACWTLANEYDVSLRTLDMALWALGGED
ncbi:hypothetical protein DV706_08485 [Natronorubrum bangense]|uniref:Uncharacterized protein n=2 Tax=Natronorubrum bangense TaxID=61858 RepID=L9WNP1_9EURY|nr:hypothetical protein C494_04346 [Natronorubrum bangense JCM 10635]QCC54508.1 hypothetical protein DV706_08485 [Natronorubrum bangense]